MTTDEMYIFRLMFQNKIYSSDGGTFQDLFVSVMCLVDSNFNPIKPHGNIGDRKNDGFNKTKGIYYQVYAPEDSKITHNVAIDKCKTDFAGLKLYWDKISPIKHFYFVLNDKYKGAYPELHEVLSELGSKNPTINFDPFLSKDLENNFLNLSKDNIIKVVGISPRLDQIEQIDYSAMTQVVDYLLKGMIPHTSQENYIAPDFEDILPHSILTASADSSFR